MSEVWDLVVVGAGPAGATAALAALRARAGARVLLLDRQRFPRDKSCGDGIAPHVLDVLGPLGAADVVAGWAPIDVLRLSRGERQVRGRMARPVHVVPRAVFDARLVDRAVDAGAQLRHHRVRRLELSRDHVELDGEIRARRVVAADGAHSAVRRWAGGRAHRHSALALRGYAPTPAARRGSQVIRYGEGTDPSYAWAFDRGDGLSNVGYGELVGRGRHPSRALLLDQLETLLPGYVEAGTDWRAHHLPLSGWGWRGEQPDGPVLLAGDAAGLVNPMTGEGIYYAVATGALAGAVAVSTAPAQAGRTYRAAVRRLLARHLRHTCLAARLTTRPGVVEAGITAAARDRRCFDDLVELGLGGGRLTPRLVSSLAAGLVGNAVQDRRDPATAVAR